MPKLIMSDGRRLDISYEKAVKIKQVLDCEIEPEDDVQADFVAGVKEVVFERMGAKPIYTTTSNPIEHDTVIDDIAADQRLSGYDKFKAVGNRLKERPKHR